MIFCNKWLSTGPLDAHLAKSVMINLKEFGCVIKHCFECLIIIFSIKTKTNEKKGNKIMKMSWKNLCLNFQNFKVVPHVQIF